MRKHKLLFIFSLLLAHTFSFSLLAANPPRRFSSPKTEEVPLVRGQVQTASKDLMSDVKVTVKRTAKTVKTDANGHFTIQAAENDVLIFTIAGFHTKEVKVEKASFFNVAIEEQTALGIGKKDKTKRFGKRNRHHS